MVYLQSLLSLWMPLLLRIGPERLRLTLFHPFVMCLTLIPLRQFSNEMCPF